MILGIDLGSSFFKASLFNPDGRVLGQGTAPVPYLPAESRRVEIPVKGAQSAFHACVQAALQGAGARMRDIAACAITSQAQTFTVADPQGRALFPFISWRDTRTIDDNIAATALAEFPRHCSVAECLPCLTVAQLAFRRRQTGQGCTPGDSVLFLPTWFVRCLTGKSVVDTNLAAMSGLYSLPGRDWWPAALDLCGLTPANLPVLAEIGTPAGRTTTAAEAFGLPTDIPVILAGNDQTAGAFGAGIESQQAALITLGTAQVVYACRPDLPPPTPGMIRGPYPEGRYYQLAADTCGAATINWVCSVLPGCETPQALDRLAESASPDCHGVRFLADGPNGTGRWTGTGNPQATTADQARAVFLCLADRMADMLARFSPRPTRALVAGGGRHSAIWMDTLEHRLGIPLQPVDHADPARGAFRLVRKAISPPLSSR